LANAQIGQQIFYNQPPANSFQSVMRNNPIVRQVVRQSAFANGDATSWSEAMAGQGVYAPVFGETTDIGAIIGGGRGIGRAIFDRNWLRMALFYGGFGNSSNNGGDIFDGRGEVRTGIFGVDIGRRHSDYLRSSIDFTFRSGQITSATGNVTGDMEVYSLLKNVHLDFPVRSSGLRPYVGLGAGIAYSDSVGTFAGLPAQIEGDTTFAWQALGGLAYKVSRMGAFYAEYRFFSTQELELVTRRSVVSRGNFSTNDFLFGLRFGF